MQTAFTEYWQAVKSADERVERLTKALLSSISGWRFESVVEGLQALRGVAAITAIGLVAEIGDLNRFENFFRAGTERDGALAVKAHAARTVERAADADHN